MNPEISPRSFETESASGERLVQGGSRWDARSAPLHAGEPRALSEPALPLAGEEIHSLCRLTTFAWTGAGVETWTQFASAGNRFFLRLAASGEEVQRVWNSASVRLVPCTSEGRPSGPALEGNARVLGPDEEELARAAMGSASGGSAGFLRTDEAVYVEVLPAR